jgi:hypothetical protein
MQPTTEEFSKRAGILKRVLDWVNQNRYEDHDSWMLLGSKMVLTATDTEGEHEELEDRDEPEGERVHQALGDLRAYDGKVLDAKRTSLNPRPPKAVVRGLEDPEEIEPGANWRAMEEPSLTKAADGLDAFYASQLIGKLENVVERATSLDPHKVDASQIHDPKIRAYFEEAHRCYLYGFSLACAVMCRAILESALKAKFDPEGRIELELYKAKVDSHRSIERRSPKEDKSLFRTLIEKSGLDEALKDAAERAKKGGDLAIHNYERFQKEYQSKGKVAEGLDTTRDVLANLYPQPTDPEI